MAVTLPDWRIVGGGFDSGSGFPKHTEEVPGGIRNGVNRTFTLKHVPLAGWPIQLYLDGVYQNRFIVEYTQTGAQITYAVAPNTSQHHAIVYWIGPGGAPVGPLVARSFNGSSDVVNYGDNAAFKIIGDLSAAIWFNITSAGVLMFEGNDVASGPEYNDLLEFSVHANGSQFDIHYNHEDGSNHSNSHTFTTALEAGTWYFGALSRDTTAKTVKLYIGTENSPLIPMGTFTYSNNPDGGQGSVGMVIGNGAPPASNNFIGVLQQHYMWSRTQTIDEFQAAANGSPSMVRLVLACTMGNDPEVDYSATGASGAVTGTTLAQGHS